MKISESNLPGVTAQRPKGVWIMTTMFADAMIISLNCRHAAGCWIYKFISLGARKIDVQDVRVALLMGFLHAHLLRRPTVNTSPVRRVNKTPHSRPKKKNNWHFFFVSAEKQSSNHPTMMGGLVAGWLAGRSSNRDNIVTSWKAAHKSHTNATLQRNESADKKCQTKCQGCLNHPTTQTDPHHTILSHLLRRGVGGVCPQGRFYSERDSNWNQHLMFAFWPYLPADKRATSSPAPGFWPNHLCETQRNATTIFTQRNCHRGSGRATPREQSCGNL